MDYWSQPQQTAIFNAIKKAGFNPDTKIKTGLTLKTYVDRSFDRFFVGFDRELLKKQLPVSDNESKTLEDVYTHLDKSLFEKESPAEPVKQAEEEKVLSAADIRRISKEIEERTGFKVEQGLETDRCPVPNNNIPVESWCNRITFNHKIGLITFCCRREDTLEYHYWIWPKNDWFDFADKLKNRLVEYWPPYLKPLYNEEFIAICKEYGCNIKLIAKKREVYYKAKYLNETVRDWNRKQYYNRDERFGKDLLIIDEDGVLRIGETPFSDECVLLPMSKFFGKRKPDRCLSPYVNGIDPSGNRDYKVEFRVIYR